jgi:NAD(P)-dependent dehydrogenase (short-subunit alcohol dehydrogenase family)
MAPKSLDGKVAVVTGAANGIGRAIVEELFQEGMSVCLADIERPELEEAARDCARLLRPGRRVTTRVTDVSRLDQVKSLAAAVRADFGSVHLLCANAGTVTPFGGAPDETPLEDWHLMMAVNLYGVVHCLQAFMPGMRSASEDSHVLITASSAGILATGNRAAYCASKHAVVGLGESLYLQLKGTHIGVSLLCPGLTATRLSDPDRNRPPGAPGRTLSAAFLTRAKAPSDVARQAVAGVKSGRFWILTHDDLPAAVLDRARAIASGEPPPDSYH